MPSVHCRYIDELMWEQTPPSSFALANSLHIWSLQLSDYRHRTEEFISLLHNDELLRADKYHNEKDRQRFIISRAILRLLLSKYLGVPATEIQFNIGDNKKPFVQTGATNVHYNVSHTNVQVAIAICDHPVGIDTEYTATEFDYSEILPACFTEQEINNIQRAADSRKQFYLCWTRKEALVKATAKGMDDDIILVPCLDGAHHAAAEETGSGKDWEVLSFETGTDNICSVAYAPAVQACFFYAATGLLTIG